MIQNERCEMLFKYWSHEKTGNSSDARNLHYVLVKTIRETLLYILLVVELDFVKYN